MADLIRELQGLDFGARIANNLAVIGEKIGAGKRAEQVHLAVNKILSDIDLEDPRSTLSPQLGQTLFDLSQAGPEGASAAQTLSAQLSLGQKAIDTRQQERQIGLTERNVVTNEKQQGLAEKIAGRPDVVQTPGGGSIAVDPDNPTKTTGRVTPDEIDLVTAGLLPQRERPIYNAEGDEVIILQRPQGYVDPVTGETVETNVKESVGRLNATGKTGSGTNYPGDKQKIKVSVQHFIPGNPGIEGAEKYGTIGIREREDFPSALEKEVGAAKQAMLSQLGRYTSLGLNLNQVLSDYETGTGSTKEKSIELDKFIKRVEDGEFDDKGVPVEAAPAVRQQIGAWLNLVNQEKEVRNIKEGKPFGATQMSKTTLTSLDNAQLGKVMTEGATPEEQAEAARILFNRGVLK